MADVVFRKGDRVETTEWDPGLPIGTLGHVAHVHDDPECDGVDVVLDDGRQFNMLPGVLAVARPDRVSAGDRPASEPDVLAAVGPVLDCAREAKEELEENTGVMRALRRQRDTAEATVGEVQDWLGEWGPQLPANAREALKRALSGSRVGAANVPCTEDEVDWYEAGLQSILQGAVLDENDLPLSEDRFDANFGHVLAQLQNLPEIPYGRDPIIDALWEALSDCRRAVERRAQGLDPFRAGHSAWMELFN